MSYNPNRDSEWESEDGDEEENYEEKLEDTEEDKMLCPYCNKKIYVEDIETCIDCEEEICGSCSIAGSCEDCYEERMNNYIDEEE